MRLEKATPDHLQMLEDAINLESSNYRIHTKVAKSLSGAPTKTSSDLLTTQGKVIIGEGEEHKAYIKFKSEGYTKLAEILLRRIRQTKPVEVLNPPNAKPKKVSESKQQAVPSGLERPRPIRNRGSYSADRELRDILMKKYMRAVDNQMPFGTASTSPVADINDTPEEGETLEF